VEALEHITGLRKRLRARSKRKALEGLIGYIGQRLDMLDYPRFRQANYQIGSGPTEAFCKTFNEIGLCDLVVYSVDDIFCCDLLYKIINNLCHRLFILTAFL